MTKIVIMFIEPNKILIMPRKNNYPQTRKPTKPVKCPICGKACKARGIKIHVRMIHGVDYVEILKSEKNEPHRVFALETPGSVISPDETIDNLLKQLEIAHQNRQSYEHSVIVEEIAKVRATMGWSADDIAKESAMHLNQFRILEPESSPPH